MTDDSPQQLERSELRSILEMSVDPFRAEALIREALEQAGESVDAVQLPMAVVREVASQLPSGVAGRRARKRLDRLIGSSEPRATAAQVTGETVQPETGQSTEPGHGSVSKKESAKRKEPDILESVPEDDEQGPVTAGEEPETTTGTSHENETAPAATPPEDAALSPEPQGAEPTADASRTPHTWLLLAVLGLIALAVVYWLTLGGNDSGEEQDSEEPAETSEQKASAEDPVEEKKPDLPPYDAAVKKLVTTLQEGGDLFSAVDPELIELVGAEEFRARRSAWVQRQLDVNRLYGEELALQTLGLLPDGFHYPQFLQDTLSEPVAHFFDEEAGVVVRTEDGLPVALSLPPVPKRPRKLKGAAPAAMQAALSRLDEDTEPAEEGSGDGGSEGDDDNDDSDDSGDDDGDDPEVGAGDSVAQEPLPPSPAPFPFRESIYALQYQHFDLAEKGDVEFSSPVGSDRALAVMALLQGDAFAIWLAAQHPEVDFWAPGGTRLVDEIEVRIDSGGALVGTPAFLQAVAKFPELEGARWVHSQLDDGEPHSSLFGELPPSTQAIYSRSAKADPVASIQIELPVDQLGVPVEDLVYEGTLGELGLRKWLELVGLHPDAATVTSGWDGDHLWCFAVGRKALVIHGSVWENEAAASAFEEAARLLYVQRYGPVHHYQSRVHREGNVVVWMEGVLPSKKTGAALKEIASRIQE